MGGVGGGTLLVHLLMASGARRRRQGEGTRSAEMLVWMGDFNYRIEGARDTVVARVRDFLRYDKHSALRVLLRQASTLSAPCACCAPETAHWRVLLVGHAVVWPGHRLTPVSCSSICLVHPRNRI